MAVPPPRVVLDTNVCLDLFVFTDRRCTALREALREALRAGAIEAVTCASCEQEWRAVLHYPQLALDEATRTRAMDAFDAMVRRMPDAQETAIPRLPRCADPDDQKFLQLAARTGARWLLSRDDALLALHRRCLREGGFAIVAPGDWQAPFGHPDVRDQGLSAKPV